MRIGMLVNSFSDAPAVDCPGEISHGVGLYTLELVSALLREDTDHEFLLISERPVSLPERLSGHPRLKMSAAPLGFRGITRTGIWREYAAARGHIDLLHEPEPSSGILRLYRCPLVVSVHDVIPMLFPRLFNRIHGLTFRAFAARNIARADAVIASSEHTRRDLEKVLPVSTGKTRVVHLAGQSLDLAQRSEAGERTAQPYILSVATLEPRKNHVALLDAFHHLRERGIALRLVLTGSSGWRNGTIYKHPALDLYGDDIVFTGVVSRTQLADLYRSALAFVYPTLYEGFGMPALEALAAGVPTIVGRNSCLPEVLGDAAYYVSAHPTGAEIAKAVESLVTDRDLHSALSSKGRQRAGEFSWRKTAAETLDVYEDVLRRRTRC